jgi:plasmid stabilization system protein ParE
MILFASEALSDMQRVRSFLQARNPNAATRAMHAIWAALQQVERLPEIGTPTKDPSIRQIVVRFGRYGYIVRYTVLPENGAIFVARIWHGRELRE